MNASNNCNVSVHPPSTNSRIYNFSRGNNNQNYENDKRGGERISFNPLIVKKRGGGGEIQFSQHGFPQTVQRGAKFNRGKFSNFFAGNNNNNRNCNGISFNSLSRKVKVQRSTACVPSLPPLPSPSLHNLYKIYWYAQCRTTRHDLPAFLSRCTLYARGSGTKRIRTRSRERERERKWSSRRMHGVVSIFAHAWTGLCAERRGEESSACLKFLVHTVGMV